MITLLIYGTPYSESGIQELVIVGRTNLTKKEYPYSSSFLQSGFSIQVCHCKDELQYILSCNPTQVVSNGSIRDGGLYFGITIPKGKRLANRKSPYDILMEIKAKFFDLYMEQCGTRYMFKEVTRHSRIPFEEIISRYSLEDSSRYIEMSGSQQANISLESTEQLREFLRDTQYEEFRGYGRVVVGLNGTCGNPLGLSIPRISKYKLYVNDKFVEFVPINEEKTFTISAEDKRCQEDYELTINLDKLPENFSRDDENGIIKGRVYFKDKVFKRYIVFKPEDPNILNWEGAIIQYAKNEKKLSLDEHGKLFVNYIGKEVFDDWKVKFSHGDYLFTYKHSTSVEDDTDVIEVTHRFKGVKITGIEPFIKEQIKNIKLRAGNNDFDVSLETENSSWILQCNGNGLKENDIANPPSLRIPGYNDAIFTKRENVEGWSCFPMPHISKIDNEQTVIPKKKNFTISVDCAKNWPHLNRDDNSNSSSDDLEEVTINVKYKTNYVISTKVKNKDDKKLLTFSLPEDGYEEISFIVVEFIAPGYEKASATGKDNKFIMPQLKESKPDFWDSIKHYIIPLIALIIGVISFILGAEFAQSETGRGFFGDESTEVPYNTNNNKTTPDERGKDNGPTIEEESGQNQPSTDSKEGKNSQYKSDCEKYYKKMKTADVSFDEAKTILDYIESVPPDCKNKIDTYDKPKTMATAYKDAAQIIKDYNDKEMIISDEELKMRLKEIDGGVKSYSDLKKFRSSIQTLFINFEGKRRADEYIKYLNQVIVDNPRFYSIQSFKQLEAEFSNFNNL